jgi:hypothetical protein
MLDDVFILNSGFVEDPEAYHRTWTLWQSELMTKQGVIDMGWFDIEFDIYLHESEGQLAFRFNGEVQKLGPLAPPEKRKDRITGIRTYYNKCPSYTALGAYMHGYYFRVHPATVCADDCDQGVCPEDGTDTCPQKTACLGPQDKVCGQDGKQPCNADACEICLHTDPEQCSLPATKFFITYIQGLDNSLRLPKFVIDYDDYRVQRLQ